MPLKPPPKVRVLILSVHLLANIRNSICSAYFTTNIVYSKPVFQICTRAIVPSVSEFYLSQSGYGFSRRCCCSFNV